MTTVQILQNTVTENAKVVAVELMLSYATDWFNQKWLQYLVISCLLFILHHFRLHTLFIFIRSLDCYYNKTRSKICGRVTAE